MNITIDGKNCACEKGEFLRNVAERNGVQIPALCHHDGLPGQGCCRVCIVELIVKGRSQIVASCVYPVADECQVLTDSEKVQKQRGITLSLLQKRAPDSDVIRKLCDDYHAPALSALKDATEGGKCILCGLCVTACAELGAGAIATINRGITKEIATPYHEPAMACIGCGSCARVCPTKAVEMSETGDTRTIWNRTFELQHCTACDTVIGTREEITFANHKAGLDARLETDGLCDECRRKRAAKVMAGTYGIL